MKQALKIPFWNYTREDSPHYDVWKKYNGSLVDYVEQYDEKAGRIEWRDNYIFTTELEVTSYGRGRSAANFNLQDSEGHNYNCFMNAIIDIIRDSRFSAGKITATWTFEKRGQNYGIKLAKIQE